MLIVLVAAALMPLLLFYEKKEDRFIKKQMLNRCIGLPLYYAGQFLLAFSVGVVR